MFGVEFPSFGQARGKTAADDGWTVEKSGPAWNFLHFLKQHIEPISDVFSNMDIPASFLVPRWSWRRREERNKDGPMCTAPFFARANQFPCFLPQQNEPRCLVSNRSSSPFSSSKHRQVRSINESASSDNMPSSSLHSFSVSRTPSPSPPPTPANEKDPPPKPRRLRGRDLRVCVVMAANNNTDDAMDDITQETP